jgi:hypothetical protein
MFQSIRGTELIPGYDLASLLSLRFVVLPAKVITFPESSKLFVKESKAWPNGFIDFCLKRAEMPRDLPRYPNRWEHL